MAGFNSLLIRGFVRRCVANHVTIILDAYTTREQYARPTILLDKVLAYSHRPYILQTVSQDGWHRATNKSVV